MNLNTEEWTDGLFSRLFREINLVEDEDRKKYICFDGDIDPMFIERINSVMDDNKLLTLSNGERLKLQSNCSILFEVGNLNFASPSIVSRAGVIYVDPENLGYIPYWEMWLKSRNINERTILNDAFMAVIPTTISFIRNELDSKLKFAVERTDLNMVQQLCSMLDAICPKLENNLIYNEDILQCSFIECIYYSIGAIFTKESRSIFDLFIKKNYYRMQIDDSPEFPADYDQYPKNTLFDYFFDKDKKQWICWDWICPKYVHNPDIKFNDILVPTLKTLRTEMLLEMMKDVSS